MTDTSSAGTSSALDDAGMMPSCPPSKAQRPAESPQLRNQLMQQKLAKFQCDELRAGRWRPVNPDASRSPEQPGLR